MYQPHNPRPEEPFFALLGRDEKAEIMARAYGYLEQGQVEMAMGEIGKAAKIALYEEPKPPHHEKVRSCFETADRMRAYRITELCRDN